LNVAGKDITAYIRSNINHSLELSDVQIIKEQLCYVPLDYDEAMK
jgi:hypothetical protein